MTSSAEDAEGWSARQYRPQRKLLTKRDLIKALEERSDLRYVSDIKPDRAEEFEQKFAARVFFTPKKIWVRRQQRPTSTPA